VAAGQLIVPFGPPLALETGYWLVWRRGPGTTRPLTAFRTWLAEELRVFRGNVGFFQIWNDPALALGIV
jgi:DNA-binding transcriptional LysR family regulator